jgi:glutaconate CoA-transferase subunit B
MYFASRKTILFREEHSCRVLVPKVDFISAPGWSPPGVERRGGPAALLTGKALFSWQPERRRFRLESFHDGFDEALIRENTGFEFDVSPALKQTSAPSEKEIMILRGEVAKIMAADYPDFAKRVWGLTV